MKFSHYVFILLFAAFFSGVVTSAEVTDAPPSSGTVINDKTITKLTQGKCGVTVSNNVIPGDGTICSNDIAFGMLYELFPSIFNELIPLWDLTSFSTLGDAPSKPELLGEYRGDQVFFLLFDFFYDLVLVSLFLYLGLIILSFAIRAIKGDDLNDANTGKDTLSSFAIGVGIGGSFLVSYKKFFVGQMVLFTIGLIALSMTNFFYSLFLAGNQAIFKTIGDPTVISANVADGVVERHDFMADHYYRYLTKVEMCRIRSAEYIMSATGANYLTEDKYKVAYKCASGNPEQNIISNNWGFPDAVPPFTWSENSMPEESHGSEILYGGLSKILFQTRTGNAQICTTKGESIPQYNCGEIKINEPDWGRNALVRILNSTSIMNSHLKSLSDAIGPETPSSEVQAIVQAKWKLLREDLYSALEKSWVAGDFDLGNPELITVNNEVVRDGANVRSVLEGNAQEHFWQASQFFHQAAMNMLMFGNSLEYVNLSLIGTERELVYGDRDLSSTNYHLNNARVLADLVHRAQCNEFKYGLGGAAYTMQYLEKDNDGDFLPQGAHARCYSMDLGKVLEYTDVVIPSDLTAARNETIARYDELQSELSGKWDIYVGELSKQRRAIEASFAESVRNEGVDEWWVNLRQEGYLSAGGYAQKAGAVVQGYKRKLKQVVNNYSVTPPSYDDYYISNDLLGRYKLKDVFSSMSFAGTEIMNSTNLDNGIMDPLISSSEWIVKQEMMIRDGSLGVDSTSMVSDIANMLKMPRTYMDRLGVSLSPGDKDPEECLTDPTKCSFPLSDPLVELSMMGHDMLDVSSAFFLMAIPAKALSGKTSNNILMKLQKSSASISGGMGFGVDKGVKALGSLVSLASMIDVIYDAMSTIMVGFSVAGIALAYILPLVPTIYLYLTFISWVSVLIMSAFAVLLWSMFWFRYKEKRDLLKSAAMHYGLELLFKPLFSLIAVLFSYYFFYIIAFIIGTGIGWLWGFPIHSEGSIVRPFFNTLMVIIMLVTVFVVGYHMSYKMMDGLISEMMKTLGVKSMDDNDKVSAFVKAMLFDAAKNSVDSMNKNISRKFGRDAAKSDMVARSRIANDSLQAHRDGFQGAMNGATDSKGN